VHQASVLTLALLACSPAVRGADLAPPLGRLSDTVIPSAYRLDLNIDPRLERFSGHTEIDATLTRSTATIFLHGNELTVTRVRVAEGSDTVDARYTQVDPSGVVRLDLPHALAPGKIHLELDYSAAFRTGPEGLFRAKVGQDWYAWSQFEPTDARRMFPGFDEPGFKTPFSLTVTAPVTAKVFANTPEASASTQGALRTHHFAPTRPLPSYLVALGVGPFDVVETQVPPNEVRQAALPFRVIATKGQLERMQFAATEAPKLLTLLEQYFKIAYPFEKLDFLASPSQTGAMENAGLILFEDSLILLDKDAPGRELSNFGDVSAHEMAHQWVGDLVTPTWWTDIWLNESFAEWMGDKAADQWRPDLGIGAGQLYDAFSAMDLDALGRSRPIHQTIAANSEIESAFDAITYLKGAQVLSMFESYLGKAGFARGVNLHLSRHRYGNATAEDFFRALAEASSNDKVVAAMRSFIDQSGVPLVMVRDEPQAIRLAQQSYRPIGLDTADSRLWKIPVCMSRGAARTCTLLETTSATTAPLPGPAVPLMPDAEAAGYYRFSLDSAAWGRLVHAAAVLPGREALAVGDNLWADFAAGRVPFSRVIEGARALSSSNERLAVIDLSDRLRKLAETLLKPEQIASYRELVRSIYEDRLMKLGVDIAADAYASEPVQRGWLRQSLVSIVALEGDQPALRAKLNAAAVAYLKGDRHALAAGFRRTALTVAAQEGGVPILMQLKRILLTSQDPQLKNDASVAIGAVRKRELTSAALDIALTPGISTPNAEDILSGLASHAATRRPATDFVEHNLKRLLEAFPGPVRPALITMSGGYCASEDADRVDAFFRPRLKDLGSGALELAETEQRIRLCAALSHAKAGEIAAALPAPHTKEKGT
jgi:aminopeptidase N